VSGFSAPIGGYFIDGPAHLDQAGAEPVWKRLRAHGKWVVAATFPGADGIDVRVPGTAPIVQPASERTVDYSMPFGGFSGPSGTGVVLTAADFTTASATPAAAFTPAGKTSCSPIKTKVTSLETFTVNTKSFAIQFAALDTTNDEVVNYNTLAFYDSTLGILAGPFALPSTGPAYVKNDGHFQRFFFEGTPNKAGCSYFVSTLAPDLSTVRLVRYAGYNISRNSPAPAVIAAVDDINNNVGFWPAGPDVSPGTVTLTHNIDMAPTINRILGVVPAPTVEGSVLPGITPRVLPTLVAQTMPNGIAIGGVTQTSAVLWAQSTATGTVTFQVATDVAFADVVKSASDAAADATIPVTVAVQDLLPGTALQMRVRNAAGASLTGRFRTNAATGKGARLGFGGDWRDELGSFPAVAALAAANLDVFIADVDTIYGDYPSPAVNKPAAETQAEYRAKHAEVYGTSLGLNT